MNAKIKIIVASIVCVLLFCGGFVAGFRTGDSAGRNNGESERSLLASDLIEAGRFAGYLTNALRDADERSRTALDRLDRAREIGQAGLRASAEAVAGAGKLTDGSRKIVELARASEVGIRSLVEVVRILDP